MSVPLARIRPDSPRYRTWAEVFGCDVVPIESVEPHEGIAPWGANTFFFKLSVAALSPMQRLRLITHMVKVFNLDAADVSQALNAARGCPILAQDVEVIDS